MLRDGHASEEYQEGEEVEEVIMYHCVSQSVGFGWSRGLWLDLVQS